MENSTFLIEYLKMSKAVKQSSEEDFAAAITAINALEYSESIEKTLLEFVKDYKEDLYYSKKIVTDCVHIRTKEFYEKYLELAADDNPITEEKIDYYITNDKSDNGFDKYMYYNMLAKKVISYGSAEMIQKAIDKLQTVLN